MRVQSSGHFHFTNGLGPMSQHKKYIACDFMGKPIGSVHIFRFPAHSQRTIIFFRCIKDLSRMDLHFLVKWIQSLCDSILDYSFRKFSLS